MKKKKIIFIGLLIILTSYHIFIKAEGINLRNKTYAYLETKGCYKKQIKDIRIKYSFINLFLSYNTWNIKANIYGRYEYTFMYKNKKIILTGLNDQKNLSKKEYENLIKKLENSNLCNKEEDLLGEESKHIFKPNLISMEIIKNSLTDQSATFVLVNHTDKTYVYGEAYSLEYEKDNIWHQIIPLNDLVFNLIGYNLKPHTSKEIEIDWSYHYGALMPGKYRIIKDAFLNESVNESVYIEAQFIIT